jgi:hypothetical protein
LQTLCSSSSGALNGKDSIESIELSWFNELMK